MDLVYLAMVVFVQGRKTLEGRLNMNDGVESLEQTPWFTGDDRAKAGGG